MDNLCRLQPENFHYRFLINHIFSLSSMRYIKKFITQSAAHKISFFSFNIRFAHNVLLLHKIKYKHDKKEENKDMCLFCGNNFCRCCNRCCNRCNNWNCNCGNNCGVGGGTSCGCNCNCGNNNGVGGGTSNGCGCNCNCCNNSGVGGGTSCGSNCNCNCNCCNNNGVGGGTSNGCGCGCNNGNTCVCRWVCNCNNNRPVPLSYGDQVYMAQEASGSDCRNHYDNEMSTAVLPPSDSCN